MDENANRLKAIEGSVPDLLNLPPGCTFYDRCSDRMDRCTNHFLKLFGLIRSTVLAVINTNEPGHLARITGRRLLSAKLSLSVIHMWFKVLMTHKSWKSLRS